MEAKSLWERKGEDAMSGNLYAFWITFWTAIGIASSAVGASATYSSEYSLLLIIPAIITAIFGVFITRGNDDLLVSLGGYLLVTVSLGVITGPVVALYTDASGVSILLLTTMIVVGLGIIGAIYPQSLQGWLSWLFGGLLLLLTGQVFVPLAAYLGFSIGNTMTILDWAGVAVFSGLVVFDLNRAMRIPYTMKNAIDASLEVYLDFINLFLRLLSLIGEADRE